MSIGVCRLTGETGLYVRSHLIPRAFTNPEVPGAPLIQYGSGKRQSQRWTSWYDERLVTRSGEDILAKLDSWAVKTLRKHKLVWSGWGSNDRLIAADHHEILQSGVSFRSIHGIEPNRLRLFFLSLLWRAAATERSEFSEVSLSPADLNTLGQMLVRDNPAPLEFYPAALLQFSTLGPIHNFTPLADAKVIPNLPGLGAQTYPIFRFYLDGLVAHIHDQARGPIEQFGPTIVGSSDALTVATIPYDDSFQQWNVRQVFLEARKPNDRGG